jgi:hypothetical protein
MTNFKAHWKYLKYVIRHKWFVFREGRVLKVSYWQLFIHDFSKFLPCEWFPYVRYFNIEKNDESLLAFDHAWNHHQKANPHHWQYWILVNDSSEPKIQPLEMPDKYVREMVADWSGAGLAITGTRELSTWYNNNKEKIILHPNTRELVHQYIAVLAWRVP